MWFLREEVVEGYPGFEFTLKKILSIQGALLYPMLPYIYHPETGEV